MPDIFRIIHLLLAKKVTTELLNKFDWLIVSRQIQGSPGSYESYAIKKEDFIASILSEIPLKSESFGLACSDLTSPIVAATEAGYYDIPYKFKVTEVIATLLTAQASGSTFTVNLYKNGVSILSTLLTIDNGDTSSLNASIAAVIDSAQSTFQKGDRFSVDVTQVGNGTATGLIVTIVGNQIAA